MYHVYRNQAAAAYWSLYFSFFFLSNFQTLKFFVILFSGTVRPRSLKLYPRGQWADVSCIPACCCSYSSLYFFIFLSLQFSHVTIFRQFFLGTVRSWRLKLGTPMDSGQIYRVYQNQAVAAYLSLYFFIFLSLQFSNIKIFRHIFLRNCEALKVKLGTHVDGGQMYCVYQNQAAAAYSSLYFFIFLSLQFLNITSFRHTFLRNCEP